MTFQRARNKEQIAQRERDIMQAAMDIFDELGLEEVTFVNISERTKVTRPTIYQYFKTREEVMLKLILLYLEKFVFYFEKAFEKKEDNKYIADALTNVFIEIPQFIKLYTLLYSVVEKNVSLVELVEFKVKAIPLFYKFLATLKTQYPDADDIELYNFITFYLSFASGLYPMTKETDLQREAAKLSNTGYQSPNFESVFKSTLLIYLEKLGSSSKNGASVKFPL